MPTSSHHGYRIDHAPTGADLDVIHAFLVKSYWSPGIARETMERGIRGSLPFVLRDPAGALAGFARVVTDTASFGYICDLFVLPQHRGKGLSKFLTEHILTHPELHGMRRWMLATDDAHGLYRQFGFTPLAKPDVYMEKRRAPSAGAPPHPAET